MVTEAGNDWRFPASFFICKRLQDNSKQAHADGLVCSVRLGKKHMRRCFRFFGGDDEEKICAV
ncbi:hypothetical protein D3Z58_07105 [Clostridiaceae bacterium]|nr:hypothetical protein [Clostridiaceae bacterium]